MHAFDQLGYKCMYGKMEAKIVDKFWKRCLIFVHKIVRVGAIMHPIFPINREKRQNIISSQ